MFRLDHFLPFFRRRKKGEPAVPVVWAAGKIAPRAFFSDPESGRKGLIRRALKAVGLTWLSAPARRAVQAACLLAFVTLFVWVCWPYGGTDYAAHRESKEKIAAEFFLIIDPLVSLSTALAARSWVWSLTAAGLILLACVFIPRGFCGYVCRWGR